jgi:hypothetical protein
MHNPGDRQCLIQREPRLLTEKTHIEVGYVPKLRQLDEARDVISSPLVIEHATMSEVGPDAYHDAI